MRRFLFTLLSLVLVASACSPGDDSVPTTVPVDDLSNAVEDLTTSTVAAPESAATSITLDPDSGISFTAEPAGGVEVVGTTLSRFDERSVDLEVGRPAPAFSGPGFDGNLIEVTPGTRPMVVLFLAHWCPHCQAEVPELQAYIDENGLPEGVDFVAVTTANDASRDNYPADEWLEREGWTPVTIMDDDASSISEAFGLTAFPFYVFLDAEGLVGGRFTGGQPPEVIASGMRTLAGGFSAAPAETTTTTAAAAPDASGIPSSELEAFRAQPTACGSSLPALPTSEQYAEPGDAGLTGPSQLVLTTSCGELTIELDLERAPITVNAMAFLADEGYFDGTACHRYISGFVLQCGDPSASGRSGPGYFLPDEFPERGFVYEHGVVAMANAGPGTGGSQFFIVTGDASPLPNQFTVIGTVELSEEFLAALDSLPLGVGSFGETSRPLETVYIEEAVVSRAG